MASLDTRSRDILMVLLQASLPIPVSQVAAQLEITPRMMRPSLDVIETWLDERGIRLVRKPNFGVYIEASPAARENLIRDLSKQKEYLLYFSPIERVNVLTLMLLRASENPLSIDQIEAVLGISRPTLMKDLNKVENWLHGYRLELIHKPRAGLQIIGPECFWREAMTGFLLTNFGIMPLLTLCKDSGSKMHVHTSSNLTLLTAMQIEVLQPLNLPFFFHQVKRLEQALRHKFTDTSFASLVCHLALAIARPSQGKTMTVATDKIQALPGGNEATAVRQLIHEIAARTRVSLSIAEVEFLTGQVLSAKIQSSITDLSQFQPAQESNPETREIVDHIVHQASLYLHPSLKVDGRLIRALSFHLPVALNRLRLNLPIQNPLLKEVEAQYPHIIQIARKGVEKFEEKFGMPVPEDEIAYIAMHLGAAMERLRPYLGLKRRVWIVCGEGSSAASLLVSRLQAEFTDMEVVEVTSALDILRNPPQPGQVDAILTTVPIKLPNTLTIPVSPLLYNKDIARIRNALETGALRKPAVPKLREDEGQTLSMLFGESVIQLGVKARNWEQVVEIAGQLLLDTGAIDARYIQAMKEVIWQYGPYVVFAPGVALLHARPETGVNRICLSLVTLDPPVPFGHALNDPVFLAIVLGATDDHSHLKALAQLANLLSDPRKIEQIRTATSKAGVIRILSQDP